MSSAGILVLASHGDALLRDQCSEAVWLQGGAVAARGAVDTVLADYHASYASADHTVTGGPQ